MKVRVLGVGFVLMTACGDNRAAAIDASVDAGPEGCGCSTFERCVEGMCMPSPTLAFEVADRQQYSSLSVQACFRPVPPTTPQPNIITETTDGPCHIKIEGPGTPPVKNFQPGDAGELSVDLPGLGMFTLTPLLDIDGCWWIESSPEGSFQPGSRVTFMATGGADVPAFSQQLEPPAPVDFTAATPTPGQPHALTWTAAPATSLTYQIIVSQVQQTTWVTCTLVDNGAYTLPASVTSYLPNGGIATQAMWRRRDVHLEPAGTRLPVDLRLEAIDRPRK